MLSDHIKGDKSGIHPNLRRAVYAIVLQGGNENDYKAMIEILRTSSTLDEQEDILRGLGYFRNPKVVRKVFNFVLSDDLKKQNVSIHKPADIQELKHVIVLLPLNWTWRRFRNRHPNVGMGSGEHGCAGDEVRNGNWFERTCYARHNRKSGDCRTARRGEGLLRKERYIEIRSEVGAGAGWYKGESCVGGQGCTRCAFVVERERVLEIGASGRAWVAWLPYTRSPKTLSRSAFPISSSSAITSSSTTARRPPWQMSMWPLTPDPSFREHAAFLDRVLFGGREGGGAATPQADMVWEVLSVSTMKGVQVIGFGRPGRGGCGGEMKGCRGGGGTRGWSWSRARLGGPF